MSEENVMDAARVGQTEEPGGLTPGEAPDDNQIRETNVAEGNLEEHTKYVRISVRKLDQDGNEVISRMTVPVINEKKETGFKIVKRKRMVPKVVQRGKKKVTEETEEEYGACMKVETVTQTVQIRDVQENGNVEIKEQNVVHQYFTGKERKYKYVKVEKKMEDGTREEVDEIEVEEEESEEEKPSSRRKKKYDSQFESIGEHEAGEWICEEGSTAREEFSLIEEGGYRPEELIPEEKEWKGMEEHVEEAEEETLREETLREEDVEVEEVFMLPTESSWDTERRQKKIFFFKLTKLFFREIEKRKTSMRNLKDTRRFKKMKIKSDKTHKEFMEEEAAEVEILMEHLKKVYAEYKEEEEEQYEESRNEMELPWEEMNDKELKVIRQAAKRLLKGMPKLIDTTLKYDDLLSKKDQPKDIVQENIDSIKHNLLAEVRERNIWAEKEKKEALGRGQEIERNKYLKTIENLACRQYAADFTAEIMEDTIKKTTGLKKDFDEEKRNYWKPKKQSKKIQAAKRRLTLADYESRFPAIMFNEKRKNAMKAYHKLKDALAPNQEHPPKDKPMKPTYSKIRVRKNCLVPLSLQGEMSNWRSA